MHKLRKVVCKAFCSNCSLIRAREDGWGNDIQVYEEGGDERGYESGRRSKSGLRYVREADICWEERWQQGKGSEGGLDVADFQLNTCRRGMSIQACIFQNRMK